MSSTTDRIPATERREQILEAATGVFGELGYAGATTDRVAKAAGISQPYVVRLFGTKEQLFIDVLERTCARILAAFDAAVADETSEKPVGPRIGEAYVELVETDRGILLALMQGFLLGHDPRIGPVARAGFMRIYSRMRDVMDADEAMRFMAQGMLINTLIASNLTEQIDDGPVDELFACTFGDKLGLVLEGLAKEA
ncbi:TetR/AcrR family transcriptional regulator [Agromyces sp. H3Y2-19a]|jgi:AcrR family transcriptional regulator|uniref:TetR/AcrR family transcriptional regulator n=1 Tax=Agromyces TaxID=33877 RepID=UPI001E634EF2|nr:MULTISPECIES: TetR/AcrR family transcriptional regulator [Agromyces]MCD5345215.1 TetR/AcrR family transcriptional regulator [Agromyces sp. S2-1-8]MDF0513626.1 TetR/AcrR family transcriptional regulator [Agromyces chromiiresistens]